jgi:hypothetical protein
MTETTLIIAAVLFVLVPILLYAGLIMVKNIVESIAFTARSEKRNRRVLEQVRRGEYPDNREYKPVDGYGYPSPTPADTAKNAVSRQTRTQNGEKVGVG